MSLAKAGKLRLLREVFETVLIPEEVREELFARPSEESHALQEAIDDGWLRVVQRNGIVPPWSDRLGRGESAAITLYRDTDAEALLLDDRTARNVARGLGIPVGGTLHVLLRGVDAGLLTSDEAHAAVNDLMRRGFRLSAQAYQTFLRGLGL